MRLTARLMCLGTVVGALLVGALLAPAVAQAAPPSVPVPDRPNDYTDYHSGAFLSGSKQEGTVIELELDDGSTPPCSNGDVLVFTSWQCGLSSDYFWPRGPGDPETESIKVYSRDPVTAERSAAAVITLSFGESAFAITSPFELPAGDQMLLEGVRDMGARIDWVLEGPDGVVFGQPRDCEIPQDIEMQWFSCEYDGSQVLPQRGRARAAAALVPDGLYTATFREYQGIQQIGEIVFGFRVGPAPVTGPPVPPDPSDPPDPTDPTDPPTTSDPGGGDGGGDGGPDGATSPTDGPTTTPTTTGQEGTSTAGESEPSNQTPTSTPVEEPEDTVQAAAPSVGQDILPWLILAVLVFTVMGTLGMPGLALGGRFAPGSTRTGGGQVPVGRWPRADAPAGGTGVHRASPGGLLGMAAGEVGAADEAVEVAAERTEGWGDRSPTWRAPGHGAVDALSATLPGRLAPRWPLLARLVDDGSPARAVLGSLSLLLPAAGLVLGAVGGRQVDGPFAPGLVLSAVLLAIGLADALAGVAAVVGFTVVAVASGAVTAGDLTLGQGLRGLVGVAALWFVVPLIAGAARPFRRRRTAGQVYAWDRAADATIAALLCGWPVQGLVASLDGLVGRGQPLTEHANDLALLTVALVAGRFGLEELAARAYPRRLATVHHDAEPTDPSLLVQLRGVVVRAGFLAFFAWAFLGSCWQLWAGVAVFALPYALALVHEHVPDARPIALTVPRGVVETLVLVVAGTALAYWIDGSASESSMTALRNGFVILAVPASVLGVLGVVGGEPPAQTWTWPRQLAGAAVVAVTLLVVLVWL